MKMWWGLLHQGECHSIGWGPYTDRPLEGFETREQARAASDTCSVGVACRIIAVGEIAKPVSSRRASRKKETK